MGAYAIGVDIGGTAVKLGLFQTDGTLLDKWQIPTRREEDGAYILPDVIDAIGGKLKETAIPWEELEGAGICVPGPVTEDGTVLRCINLGWGVFNVPERMRELEPRLQKVRVSNDGNAAALGELWKGSARGRRSACLVVLGTGIGGGIVLDGKIVTGNRGGAGEIGHLCVDPNEQEPCGCGAYGCLEQYCSASGLVRRAKRALRQPQAVETILKDGETLTAKRVCDAAKAGDALALSLLEQLGLQLGWALTSVAGCLDPEVFLIGGGLSNAGEILLKEIETGYRRAAFHVFRDTEFLLAKLGNDAGIYGCVKMIL